MAEMVPQGAVSVDFDEGVWIVALTGEHDLANVSELRATLDSVLAPETLPASRPLLVVVDLTDASFVDSSVVTAIVRAYEATQQDPEAELAVVVESPASFAARLLNL